MTTSPSTSPLAPQQTLSRRSLLKLGAGTAAALAVGGIINAIVLPNRPVKYYRQSDGTYPFALPALGYSFAALEPTISANTMTIHHDRHHQGYVDALNQALAKYPQYQNMTVAELLAGVENLPQNLQTAVRHHGGGHYNHSLFWQWLAPEGSSRPVGEVAYALNETFGSIKNLKKAIKQKASSHFGAGWVWLVLNVQGTLEVVATNEQDNPLMTGKLPILGIDLWEHAYYLDYENKRDDYVENVLDVVNWDVVEAQYNDSLLLLAALNNQASGAAESSNH